MTWRSGWPMFGLFVLGCVAGAVLVWRLPESGAEAVGRVGLVVGALCLALVAARRARARGRR